MTAREIASASRCLYYFSRRWYHPIHSRARAEAAAKGVDPDDGAVLEADLARAARAQRKTLAAVSLSRKPGGTPFGCLALAEDFLFQWASPQLNTVA